MGYERKWCGVLSGIRIGPEGWVGNVKFMMGVESGNDAVDVGGVPLDERGGALGVGGGGGDG